MPVSKWIFAVRLDSKRTRLYNTSASASWQRGGQCHLRAPDGTAIARYADGSHSCNKKLIWDLRSLVTTICDRSCKCSPIPPVPSFSMRASVASGWFCIPAKLVSYVQPIRVFALSKHAERLAGGKNKTGKGSDLEPCISLFATQQKRS